MTKPSPTVLFVVALQLINIHTCHNECRVINLTANVCLCLHRGEVKAMFTPRISVPPLCQGLGGLEGSSQRSLRRNGTIRKTFSGGMAAVRRHSQSIAVKLQAVSTAVSTLRAYPIICLSLGFHYLTASVLQDALVNLIRRAQPVFLQCVSAKVESGSLDVPTLRVQLQSTHILQALQLYRTGQGSGHSH